MKNELQPNLAIGHMKKSGVEELSLSIKKKDFSEHHKGTGRGTISNNIRYFIKKRKFPQPKAIAAAISIAEETAKKRGTAVRLRKSLEGEPILVMLLD